MSSYSKLNVLMFFLLTTQPCFALERCIGEDGKVLYTDGKCPTSSKEERKIHVDTRSANKESRLVLCKSLIENSSTDAKRTIMLKLCDSNLSVAKIRNCVEKMKVSSDNKAEGIALICIHEG